jgi:flagellar biosynthesis GTPase FlhF
MRVKTHSFEDIRQGMEKIRETYGPDTIIVDIKHNNHNGYGWSKKSCEISVALDGDPELCENDLGELRKRTESIWSQTAHFLSEKLISVESEMIMDRVKTYPLPLKILLDKMVKNGVNRHLAMSMISDVYGEIGQLAGNSVKAAFFLKNVIARRISLSDITDPDEAVMLLGPTGAGKTETAKKLARLISDRQGQVTIMVFDPIKRGSYDECKTFSDNTGIPFVFTTGIDDLCIKVGKGTGKRIIDITGHVDFQEKIAERLPMIKKVIILPAGARDEKMKSYLDKFKGMNNVAGLIFTKLDEEDSLGHLCHNLINLDRPLCSVTTGINLQDIVIPDIEILGKLFLEGNQWKREESE